ncbi:MAG: hypothetical protein ACK4V2_05675 [Pseudomonadota bacterium]|jgi:hypothetical protein|nr:hypothetical protein [Alphaproteobacteria bacterium]
MKTHGWSGADISKARNYFIAGLPIKDIAKEMNRTPTAINKALSRFKIRPNKIREQEIRLCYRPQKSYLIEKPSFELNALRNEVDNWVGFWKLCEYLGQQKVCFYETTRNGTSLIDRQFKVGEKILNAQQLMILANKIRLENNLRPFFVRGLSW